MHLPTSPLRSALLCMFLLGLGACASQPTPGGGPSGLYERLRAEFKQADKDGDDSLSREEAAAGMPELAGRFDEIDTDHNGRINFAEIWNFVLYQRVSHARPTGRERP